MRKSAVLIVLLLAAWSLVAAAAKAQGAGVTKEQLDAVIAKLVANGEAWVKDENIPSSGLADLNGLKFDKASAPVITAALRGIKRNPAGLYATGRLLEQIERSGIEAIQAILPEVRTIQMRARSYYRPFPALSKAQAESMGMPKYNPKLTTEAIMTRMGSLADRRAAKVARDLPIAKQNEAVWDIEKASYHMRAIAGTKTDDARTVNAMAMTERASDASFVTIVDAYVAAAPKMDADRAARLYQVLRPLALHLRMANKKNYTCKGKSTLHDESTSVFTAVSEYPGLKIIGLMNRLVVVAKNRNCKKLPVPTTAEIQAYNTKKPKKKKK